MSILCFPVGKDVTAEGEVYEGGLDEVLMLSDYSIIRLHRWKYWNKTGDVQFYGRPRASSDNCFVSEGFPHHSYEVESQLSQVRFSGSWSH